MSVNALTTVWCNGCGWWDHMGQTAADARREAKASGWHVGLPGLEDCPEGHDESHHRPGKPRDLCPDCWTKGLR